jgi:hypothetical protein
MKNNEKNNRNIIAYALGRGFVLAALVLLFLNCSNVDIPSTPQDIAVVSSSSEDSVSSSSEEEDSSSSSEAEPSSSSIEPLPIWSGGADTTWYTDNKSASSFVITTAEQLAGLAKLVNRTTSTDNGRYNMANKTIILGNDIMLNDTTRTNWTSNALNKPWTPIGTNAGTSGENWFRGTFDGNNSVISGIYISSSEVYQGLFGYTYNCKIQNLGVNASYIKGGSGVGGLVGSLSGEITDSYFVGTVTGTSGNAGGLAGNLYSGDITNSYSVGTVTGTSNVGGLAGISNNHNNTITGSYFAGTVTGTSIVGGLVGGLGNSKIGTSYFVGTVTGTSNNVGGLAGTGSGTSCEIATSYFVGTVIGISNVGGLMGNNTQCKINNNYSLATIAGTSNVGGLVGNLSNSNSSITNSYSASIFDGNPSNCGGLAGTLSNNPSITSSYYNSEIVGANNCQNSEYGEGETTENMQKQTTFSDWYFSTTWGINLDINNGYPYLRNNPPPAGD